LKQLQDDLRLFIDDLLAGRVRRALSENRVFKSVFRTGYPSTPRNQALIMFNNVFLHLHPVRMRRESLKVTYTFCLGGLSFFLFLLLTVTGVLLMFYYRPATAVAYQDMKDLETVVTFGMLLRNLHRYSAHGMVITVFLHMVRVFYTGAYRPPREFNWVVGVILRR
jgi:quinol-cytochrome oxidoreductase complex cytochrome b subunit